MNTLLTEAGDLTRDAEHLLRYFARRLAPPCNLDPMDLFQESVVYLLRRAGDYDPAKGSPATWLFHASRRSRNYLLAKTRLVLGRRPDALPLDLAAGSDPAAEVERADLHRRVRAALAGLPGRDRRLVVRRFGLDGRRPARLRELAGGHSSESARQWVKRAVRRLAAALAVR